MEEDYVEAGVGPWFIAAIALVVDRKVLLVDYVANAKDALLV